MRRSKADPGRKPVKRHGKNREVALVAQGRPYGTPTTLSEELIERIEKFVKLGDRPFVAAELCGVHRSKFYEWMDKGRADQLDAFDTLYARLAIKIDAAESYFEHALVMSIKRATIDRELAPASQPGGLRIPADPKVALSVLSRRRDGWQERKELTGKDGAPLFGATGLEGMADDEIEERLNGLRDRGGKARRAARTEASDRVGEAAGTP